MKKFAIQAFIVFAVILFIGFGVKYVRKYLHKDVNSYSVSLQKEWFGGDQDTVFEFSNPFS